MTVARDLVAEDTTLATLHEVVEQLAAIERGPGSEGEARAAAWLADRLTAAGATARVEPASFRDGYARLHAGLAAVGLVGAVLALRGGRAARAAAALGSALSAAAIVDDVSNGPRLARRATAAARSTQNVVAETGDADAERTLVVLAHHDAPPTGFIFDQTAQHWVADHFPAVIERFDTAAPMWWPVAAGPGLVATGALLAARRLTATGALLCAGSLAAFADIARDRIVPGANDNLSGVAGLVALAERLSAEPIQGLRVLLVSCGAEEVMQGGIRSFLADHRAELDPGRTWMLNLETVGSPRLVLLEGEGAFRMEEYRDPGFRDLAARAAAETGVSMRRGMRARSSTDSVLPSRAGYPTLTLTSVDYAKALSNYHHPSDVPENLDYSTVAAAVEVAAATARALAL